MLAAKALVCRSGDLSSKSPKNNFRELRGGVPGQEACLGLNPDFTRLIDEDVRDIPTA